MKKIDPARVVLAEPRAPVRSALRLIVTDGVGMQVVGEVADAAELWSQMQTAQPEVLLLDWSMVASQADTLLPALRATWPDLYIIALSWRPEGDPALLAGADAFVSKTDPPERLVRALQAVNACDLDAGPGAIDEVVPGKGTSR